MLDGGTDVWRRGGGAGAFLVGENTAEQEGELVAEEVDKTREEEEECDNIIKVDDEEVAAPVAELPCSAGTDGVWPGAVGVAVGQRRRSANAERDLRSCTSRHVVNVINMSKTNRLHNAQVLNSYCANRPSPSFHDDSLPFRM